MDFIADILSGVYFVHYDHFPPSFEIQFSSPANKQGTKKMCKTQPTTIEPTFFLCNHYPLATKVT